MAGFLGLLRRSRQERVGFDLYGAAVAAARNPFLYDTLGVPDTLDGRFDAISLHTFLLIQRLKREPEPGPGLAQAVFDAMFTDMDINLRELGVGDLSVGKRVRAMWEAFHGRAQVYTIAMERHDPTALQEAIARNVWRGQPDPVGAAEALTRIALAQDRYLSAQPLADLAQGRVAFLPAAEATR